ncbi:hypothetical protein [Methylorubrum thiocyanatum]|uniref:hypothetical protein n=1 Tax=Methylorubrum thiocyanatum TaxID=47958 RepID=UPI00398C54A2
MAIFDAISGGAYKTAAKNNAQMISQGLTASGDALTNGVNNALATLGTRGTGATALSALGQGYGQARNDITAGFDAAQPTLAKLGAAYDPMVQGGQNSFNAYLDAIGANGAEGNARATANFQAGPGYQYAVDQAVGALQRSAAARGGLAGGNLTADILKTVTGLADQGWQQYTNNLQNGSGFYSTGLAGQAQGLGAQANAAIGEGAALGALGQASGRDTANLYGTAANIENGFGQNVSNLWAGATANTVNNNNMLAKAQTEASGNLLGGILGGASSLGSAAGKAGGLTNLFSNIFK